MIIILNAPPGAGKDTIQRAILELTNDTHALEFKAPMFDIARSMLGDDGYSEFLQRYDNRSTKEVGCHVCGGLSPREFMIWISETVMKPRFGDKVFALRAYETYLSLDSGDMLVFSDGGFPDEVAALVEFGATVKLFRLHRDGYDFSGDSRNYIYLPELIGSRGYEEFDVNLIDGDVIGAVREIASKVGVELFE